MHDIVLECKNVHHYFRKNRVLCDINLRVVRGQFLSLVGSSGCGKSTLLRAILGTHPPKEGTILMNGIPILTPGRDRGIVYQRYSLFPFLTAVENVAFGLMLSEWGIVHRLTQFWKWRKARKGHLKQAADLLDRFGLGHALHLYPAMMSGGMCQRVAIAQALIMRPEILLLDEPFGALDEATREDQQTMLADLYKENLQAKQKGEKPPYTIILVTHELNEAITVADRVVALSRFWQWREETGLGEHPGASVVYDACTPPFPRDPVSKAEEYRAQRREIRDAAFEDDRPRRRGDYLRFWRECSEGRGVGIMQKV
jgi:NitT/TauT family transport system ATP-binding protein